VGASLDLNNLCIVLLRTFVWGMVQICHKVILKYGVFLNTFLYR